MLENKKIQINNIDIEVRDSLPKEFELKTAFTVKVKTPKNQDNKSLMLTIEMDVMTANAEDLKIGVDSNVIFKFEEIPDDYAKFAENECIPLAQEKLYDKIDEVLVIMGYNKLKLSEKMKKQD